MNNCGPMEDRLLIRELFGLYGDASCRGDADAWLELFAEDCEWKAIPRMLVAIEKEKQILDQKNIKGTYRMNRIGAISSSAKCGSAEQFFRGYFK